MGSVAPDETQRLLDMAAEALFELRRVWSARPVELFINGKMPGSSEVSRALVVRAVAEGTRQPGIEVTVGVVAQVLDVDPSRASRLVADAVRVGYVRRVTTPSSKARVQLELTEQGQEAIEAIRAHHRAALLYLTREWPERDRLEFARLISRFTGEVLQVATRRTTDVPSAGEGGGDAE